MKGAAKVNFHEEFCDGSLSAFFVYLSYRSDQNSQSDGQRASQQPCQLIHTLSLGYLLDYDEIIHVGTTPI